MSTFAEKEQKSIVVAALLGGFLLATGACFERPERAESRLPLLVTAGPDNFTRFEVRSPEGETIWRLEAEAPAPIPFLVYAIVPRGFRQTLPAIGAPRPLRLGEEVILESRIPSRIFVHRASARAEDTITILESEMRRLVPEEERTPSVPREVLGLEVEAAN